MGRHTRPAAPVGKAVTGGAEEQTPAFQATFPRAVTPKARVTLLPRSAPAPTVIYEGFNSVCVFLESHLGMGALIVESGVWEHDPKTTHPLEHKDVQCGVYNRGELRPWRCPRRPWGQTFCELGTAPGKR